MTKIFTLTLFAAAMTGCAWEGTRVDPADTASFKYGVTTEEQIVDALGSPTSEVRLPFGTKLLDYSHLKSLPNWAMYLPVFGPFFGKDNIEAETHVYKIDEEGKLTDVIAHVSELHGDFVSPPETNQPRNVCPLKRWVR